MKDIPISEMTPERLRAELHSSINGGILQTKAIAQLRQQLAEYKDAEKFIADPPHDQVCCGCVAILSKQLAEARGENEHSVEVVGNFLEVIDEKDELISAAQQQISELSLHTIHDPDCEIEMSGSASECTCGLDAAAEPVSSQAEKTNG